MDASTEQRIREIQEQAKRRQDALKMREAGKKFHEIAAALGVSSQRAEQLVKLAKKDRERAGQ